jgi:hypothetical protein
MSLLARRSGIYRVVITNSLGKLRVVLKSPRITYSDELALRYETPFPLFAHLAVHERFQGIGLNESLLKDAITRKLSPH